MNEHAKTGIVYMLRGKDPRTPGRYALLGGSVIISEDFSKPFGEGFRPPKRLSEAAIWWDGRRRLVFGRWLLDVDALRVVRDAHRGARFVMGRKLHTSAEGVRCPCGYAYVGDRLVAMIAPMDGGR